MNMLHKFSTVIVLFLYLVGCGGSGSGGDGDDSTAPPITYAIGDKGPAGGIVFYVTDGGLRGVDGGLRGLEAAPADQSAGAPWGCRGTDIADAEGTTVGTGAQNTIDILAGCAELGIAARLADSYTLNGFSDWFLPSKDELNELYLQKAVVGGFTSSFFWSSSERPSLAASGQDFSNGNVFNGDKNNNTGVRAVRAFNIIDINAPDTTVPVITLAGANPQIIEVGSAYRELGATALDNVDGNITGNIIIDFSDVDTSTIGSYSVSYDVSDASGNAAVTVIRTINIVAITPRVIGGPGPAGGIVFYVTDGGLHGLEAAPADQSAGAPWCTRDFGIPEPIAGADGTTVGTGAQNTIDILAGCAELGIAARLADSYTLNGFSDWFLPSKDELNELYLQKAVVGGFDSFAYWSSSELDAIYAWAHYFDNGNQEGVDKGVPALRVRAVRAF